MAVHSRRDLLKGAMSLSLAALGMSSSDVTQPPGAAPPRNSVPTLNVIFHGLFAFVLGENSIQAIAPDVDGHVYGAGLWRRETPMAKDAGPYALENIKPQNLQAIDETSLPLLSAQDYGITGIDPDGQSRIIVHLPMPAEIRPLARMRILRGEELFSGLGSDRVNGKLKQVAEAHAFIYRFRSKEELYSADLTLGGKSLIPQIATARMTSRESMNIHVFAESVFDLGSDHPRRVFNALKSLLPGLTLTLNQIAPCELPSCRTPYVPDAPGLVGIAAVEKEGLRCDAELSAEPHDASLHLFTDPPLICGRAASVVITNAPAGK